MTSREDLRKRKVKLIKAVARKQEVPEGSLIESKKKYRRQREKQEFRDFVERALSDAEEEENE